MSELEILTKRLIDERSVGHTTICCIEEMSELTKVLCKMLNNRSFSRSNLTEEVAHALLMISVVASQFSITQEQVDKEQVSSLRKCFDGII